MPMWLPEATPRQGPHGLLAILKTAQSPLSCIQAQLHTTLNSLLLETPPKSGAFLTTAGLGRVTQEKGAKEEMKVPGTQRPYFGQS